MKKFYSITVLAIVLATNTVNAQSDAEMKAWEAYMTPGEAHEIMAKEIGSWTADMTFWSSPGAPAEKATTSADINMIMGDRFQEMNFTGDVMGMPFEGKSTLAFDNTTKEYVSTWIDNFGTGMMVMRGKSKPGAKTLEFRGEMTDPVSGKAKPTRELYTFVDNDTRKMEMYDTVNGKEYKSMEIIMKRKK